MHFSMEISGFQFNDSLFQNLKCQVLEINNGSQYYRLISTSWNIKFAKLRLLWKRLGASIVKFTPANRYAIARVAQPNNLKSSLKVSCMNYDNNANTKTLCFRVAHYGPEMSKFGQKPISHPMCPWLGILDKKVRKFNLLTFKLHFTPMNSTVFEQT